MNVVFNTLRPIETVKGWEHIAERMGRGVTTVKKWQKYGAPIFFIDGAWMTEVAELWAWLTNEHK